MSAGSRESSDVSGDELALGSNGIPGKRGKGDSDASSRSEETSTPIDNFIVGETVDSSLIPQDSSVAISSSLTSMDAAAQLGASAALSVRGIELESIPDGQKLEPEKETKSRVLLIINNVSLINYKQKAKELLEFLPEENYYYFSQYLIVKRVCVEYAFQKAYVSLLQRMSSKKLDKYVLDATYQSIHHLLNSDSILTSSAERSLLKNLGS